MYMLALAAQEGGSLARKILADIPHDPAAIFVYALLAGSVYLIWRANRKKT